MFYVRLGERQENTTGRTPSKPLLKISIPDRSLMLSIIVILVSRMEGNVGDFKTDTQY
jgi:hypothetical protein